MSIVLLTLVLATACWTDLRTRTIPNGLVVAGLLAALGLSAAAPYIASLQALPLADALLGGAVCFTLLFAAWLVGGTGGGDVKLAAVIGMLLGWRDGVSVLFWCHVAASTVILGAVGVRAVVPRLSLATAGVAENSRDDASAPALGSEPITMPMAPFFAVGVAITLVFGSLL